MAQKAENSVPRRPQVRLYITENEWIMLRQIAMSRRTSANQLCTQWARDYIAQYLQSDSVGKP